MGLSSIPPDKEHCKCLAGSRENGLVTVNFESRKALQMCKTVGGSPQAAQRISAVTQNASLYYYQGDA